MTVANLTASLADRVRAATGENVFLCYQCLRCTSGCPVAEYFDLTPNQVLRALQLGLDEQVLDAKTPWLCAACQTCTTRCPQELDVAGIMDALASIALEDGREPGVPEAALFNKVFLRNVDLFGRLYELGLVTEMNLRTGHPFRDVGTGLQMIRKGKMKLLPEVMWQSPAADGTAPRSRPNQIAYYPGCSLHSTGVEFDRSARAACDALNLELVEPDGWVCCGASSAHRVDSDAAVRLPMESLAIIENSGFHDAALPCAACFSRFRTAQHEMKRDARLRARVGARVGFGAGMGVAVQSLLDVVVKRVGLDAVRDRVTQPLHGLTVACYYGCLLTRPPEVTGADDPENPMTMDRLLDALGATVVDWGHKVACCGASLSLTNTEIVLDLSARILNGARESGAAAVVVACPLCHANLDGRQHQMQLDAIGPSGGGAIPILYFTQLMALAFDLDEEATVFSKNMVDARPLLAELSLLR